MTLADPFTGYCTSLPRFDGGASGEVNRPSFQSNSGNQSPRILVVEGIRSTREILGLVLEEHYQIESVATYEEAVRRARATSFDAVLVSVSQGRLRSGLRAVRKIRATEGYSDVPILVVMGPNLREQQSQLRDAGGDGFLEMPFVQSELLDLLQRHLGS